MQGEQGAPTGMQGEQGVPTGMQGEQGMPTGPQRHVHCSFPPAFMPAGSTMRQPGRGGVPAGVSAANRQRTSDQSQEVMRVGGRSEHPSAPVLALCGLRARARSQRRSEERTDQSIPTL